MIYTVDRFEENLAVLEDSNMNTITVKRDILPKEAKEGSVLRFENNSYVLDTTRTQERKDSIAAKFNKLKNKD